MKLTQAQADVLRAEIVKDLTTSTAEDFAMRRLFTAKPIIFGSNDEYTKWRISVASKLGVDPIGVTVVGSGCTGISLHPFKELPAFHEYSDVDVAVVSDYHFNYAWRFLRDPGVLRYNMNRDAIAAMKQNTEQNVFWGVIATDKILQYLPFAKEWVVALNDIAKVAPISGHELKARVYRDTYSLMTYHTNGLAVLQTKLQKK